MRDINKKGLTRFGLLIIIVLLIVVICGLLVYFQNQKKRNFITMAKEYVSNVRMLATEDKIMLPDTYKERVVISVKSLEKNPNRKSPFNAKWVTNKSYVVIKNTGTEYQPKYEYFIALQDEKGNCVELTKESKLNRDLVSKKCTIDEVSETDAAYLE